MLGSARRKARSVRNRGAAYIEFLVLVALIGLGMIAAVRHLAGSIRSSGDEVSVHVAELSAFSPGADATMNAARGGQVEVRMQPIAARASEGDDEPTDPAELPGHEFDHAQNEQVPEGSDDSPSLWDRAKAYGGAILRQAPDMLAHTLEIGTGVAAGVVGVQTAGEGVGLAVAGSETVVAVPAGAAVAVAGGALALEGVKVAGGGMQHLSEDIQQAKNEADSELAPEPTRPLPKGQPNPSAKARGTPEDVPGATRQIQEDIARQNESADRLAREGYDVEHWGKPKQNAGGREPDYKINGEFVDHYNARSSSADQVRKKLVEKVVKKEQANRIVVRLDDSSVSIEQVKNLLARPDKAVKGLKEIIFIKGDTITSFVP